MNWIEFVKKYSADNNMKYGQCLKDPKCKEQYHAQKNGNKPDDSEESFTLAPEMHKQLDMPSESTKPDESILSTPKKTRPQSAGYARARGRALEELALENL